MLVAARDTRNAARARTSVPFVRKARTCKCLRKTLDNDKNGQGRENGEGEQWTPIEG